jgi:hypothetical protein
MNSFKLTENFFKTATRFIDFHFESVKAKAVKIKTNMRIVMKALYFKDTKLQFLIEPTSHSDYCECADEILTEEPCEGCHNILEHQFIVQLIKRNTDSGLMSIEFGSDDTLEEVLTRFNQLPREIQFCPCENLAKKDGLCELCYIHNYERKEEEGGDCCVCKENSGRWVQLECNHILHYHCARNIRCIGLLKCPMCRVVSNEHLGLLKDPYME